MPHKWFCETCWETHWNWICPSCGLGEVYCAATVDEDDPPKCEHCGYEVKRGEFETLDGWS
ncbi:hypothetical protein [Sulfobacillus harzensis]|uniref:Uncharacterized protein n=1 Tax=Sulfobacillus harzensis TaxID=2729629 RepID=A0A7Y0Q3A3_9FIRM|nr:hypothetical protein [Sulfobacillus harzensis]NMP24033.1 hypothetical protein [Sulfobacillus harzensis]